MRPTPKRKPLPTDFADSQLHFLLAVEKLLAAAEETRLYRARLMEFVEVPPKAETGAR